MKHPWLPWLLLVVVIAVGLFLLDQDRAERRATEARLKASEAQNVALAEKVTAAAERVAASEQREADLLAQSARREAALLAELSRIKTATPQQLVDDGARLLGASDITTDGKRVTMGVETWRGAIRLMAVGNEYEMQLKPAWVAQQAAWSNTSAALHEQIAAHEKREAGLEATIRDLNASLGHEKRASTLEKVLWGAAGIGIGMAVDRVFK